MKTAALYVRVSTDEQVENYSIPEQIERLKAYCEARDIIPLKIYIDGGYSGASLERPKLKEMLNNISEFDFIIVYKLDRLSRSQKDTLYLVEDVFMKNNTELISLSENFDTSSPFGRTTIGMLSAFSQLERETIKQRMSMGRSGRTKKGLWHGSGNPPTGYEFENGKLIVNPIEAEQVRAIFNKFLNGYSLNKIQKYAHQNFANKYGSYSTVASIYRILKNKIYAGYIVTNECEYKGVHEPIITIKDYEKAQILLNSKKNSVTSQEKKAFKKTQMLSGILRCGYCGSKCCVVKNKYQCYSVSKVVKKLIVDKNCPCNRFPVEYLDDIVINQLKKVKLDEAYLNSQFNDKNISTNNIQSLKTCINNIDRQIDKLIYLYQTDMLPKEKIKEHSDTLKEKKEKYLMQLENELKINQQNQKQNLKQIDIITHGTIEQKNLFIRQIIQEIIVFNDRLEFIWLI